MRWARFKPWCAMSNTNCVRAKQWVVISLIAMVLQCAIWESPGEAQQPSSPQAPCPEGLDAAQPPKFVIPPPSFLFRSQSPRLLIFVHGLLGSSLSSWMSVSKAYWPTLIVSDQKHFSDFDVFVHDYTIRPTGEIRFARLIDEFMDVARQQSLISQYRDVTFVVEGDGIYFVRELLERVPPLRERVQMIFAVGRFDEGSGGAARPLVLDGIDPVPIPWTEYIQREAKRWLEVYPQPWVHCAVLTEMAGPRTIARDEQSSFCSTMPLAIAGNQWRDLRPTCYHDVLHVALTRAVNQYPLGTLPQKAAPVRTESVDSQSLNVGCQQVTEGLLEIRLPVDPQTEEILSTEVSIVNADNLKAFTTKVERLAGNAAIISYRLAGLDGVLPNCPGGGHGTVHVVVVKRPKQ